ncbi:TPA: dicarboxylate/amino acid:cation symporter [Clostridium perfringens]|uniref:Cation:dicarboxylase symporter family transporter n=1 Tax=Clostridium perfringens TaxID=1502 RepID=A0AAW9HTI4_CLOPF|nr:dicarboxylate/amino acid:cation symporter [Clostridium perfringens]EDT26734.1 sodium:dicarboxylate symporter family [Clostridium perfringens CPE str. F4969]EGT0679283.1 dicarboxylate/amino acid:cation symporter [Clostridium perfringens]EJT6151747.1 dicarboxylate/amino acid:cation symporter [Clostridium perfringens]EJT6157433.1 dicarboxylate/amino acid:cation symporter [Clostridium perfringens]MBI5994444.1 dicarboxylate/amino acid:cation symporter [Clostridium perfringens]
MINIKLILAIVLSILATYAIYKIRKITNKFSFATLTALTLGVVLGIIFKENILFLDTVGKAYMSLIKMIVVPLVVTSLITSIVRLENLDTLKSIGLKTFTVLLGTTGAAALIGIIVASSLNLGQGLRFIGAENFKAREIPGFSKVLIDMLPSNPLAAIVENKIIPIVIFSMFIAIALVIEDNTNKEKAKPFKDFILSAYDIVLRITKMVLRIIPYGVFALIATAAAKNGMDTLMSLIWVILAVYIAAFLQFLFVYTPLISFVARMNPLKFFKGIFPAQVVAFTSQSSYGTLPVTIKSLVEGVGVSENIASFVAPLGSTIGLNGCGGFYPAIVAIFAANVFNVELTSYSYILIVLTAIISSIGIAGVPGSATMSTTVMLAALGLPIEALAMVIAVDSIIDMIRTATNVTGASVAALIVDQTEKRKEYKVEESVQRA